MGGMKLIIPILISKRERVEIEIRIDIDSSDK